MIRSDSGSAASPNRDTESTKDGSYAGNDWPLLITELNIPAARPRSRCTTESGVGAGYSQHSGIIILCGGTVQVDNRIAQVLSDVEKNVSFDHCDGLAAKIGRE